MRFDVVQLRVQGGREAIDDVLEQPPLKERTQGLGRRRSLEFKGILLTVIENEKRIYRYEVPTFARLVTGGASDYGFERQGRSIVVNPISARDPVQDRGAMRQILESRVESKEEGGHGRSLARCLIDWLGTSGLTRVSDSAWHQSSGNCGRSRPQLICCEQYYCRNLPGLSRRFRINAAALRFQQTPARQSRAQFGRKTGK